MSVGHLHQMETARVAANELFKAGQLAQAAELYATALDVVYGNNYLTASSSAAARIKASSSSSSSSSSLGQLPQQMLDEFTKSAGNLATCLHKLKRYSECAAMCQRALRDVNPFLAKCHAFLGMSLVDEAATRTSHPETSPSPSSSLPSVGGRDRKVAIMSREEAHMHLCRAMFLLPAMTGQLAPYIASLVDSLREDYNVDQSSPLSAGEQKVENTTIASVREAGQGCGHGVFVDAPTIAPATPIASLLRPFSAVSYSETDGLGLCAACASPNVAGNDDGLRCSQCKRVWFCSDACRTSYSLQHAEYECGAFRKLNEMVQQIESRQLDVPDDFNDIAAHCIVTRSAMKSKKEGWERIHQLEHHAVEVSQTLAPIGSLMQDLFPSESMTFLTQLVGAVRCNALEVCDATGLGIGQALHAVGVASFFNHSCAPNCAIDHRTQSILTARTVAAGDELSIAYIPQLYWPMTLRREGLADRFFFTCQCSRCVAADCGKDVMESVLRGTLPGAKPNATEYYHAVIETLCTGVRSRHVADIDRGVLKELLETRAEAERHLMPSHYTLQDLRNTLTFTYSVLSMAPEARRSCAEELLLWESIIPGRLPVKLDKLRNAAICRDMEDSAAATMRQHAAETITAAAAPLNPAVEAHSTLLPKYANMYGLA